MIREMKQEDLPRVMAIWRQANREAHTFVDAAYWDAHDREVRDAIRQAEVYVYETAAGIQGFLGLVEGYIAGVFVAAGCRSMGVGKQLLDHVKKKHSRLTLQVYQKNPRAVRFYEREDFSITARQKEEETGEWEWMMVWEQ